MTDSTDVCILVNGETVGSEPSSATLGNVADKYSLAHGIKSFSLLVNGNKADVRDGGKSLSAIGASTIEIVTKDARGGPRKAAKPKRSRRPAFKVGQVVVIADNGTFGTVAGNIGDSFEVNAGTFTTLVPKSNLRGADQDGARVANRRGRPNNLEHRSGGLA